MKLSLLIVAAIPAAAIARVVLDDDASLNLFVALETRLDHKEMHRIYSSEGGHQHLEAEKAAIRESAKAHVSPCLDQFYASIEPHGLEIIPFVSDSSSFHLSGSVKEFSSFLKNQSKGGITFTETTNENEEKRILAKFEDDQSAKNLPKDLMECVGFVGDFHPVSDTRQDNRRKLQEAATNRNITEQVHGICSSSNHDLENFYELYDISVGTTTKPVTEVQLTTPELIRELYGLPPSDDLCYDAREIALFEQAGKEPIGIDDLTCYAQLYGLEETKLFYISTADVELKDSPISDIVCQMKGYKCVCPTKYTFDSSTCTESNLDVQMLAATSPGSPLRIMSYALNAFETDLETMLKSLIQLDTLDRPPTAVSISYGGCEQQMSHDDQKHICKQIGSITSKGTTFFSSTGDGGACGMGVGGTCGEYCGILLASCPYVTAVGGTHGLKANEEVLADGNWELQGSTVSSAGGFSEVFVDTDDFDYTFQKAAVDSWLNRPEVSKSVPGFNAKKEDERWIFGRATPDISAVASNFNVMLGMAPALENGTSGATPIIAGIVSFCASQLPKDIVGFGWINPKLYQHPELFHDIVGSNNQYNAFGHSCPTPDMLEYKDYDGKFFGFEATEGWDPASGLGTIGTTDPENPEQGFRALCEVLLGHPFDFEKAKCKGEKHGKKHSSKKHHGKKYNKGLR